MRDGTLIVEEERVNTPTAHIYDEIRANSSEASPFVQWALTRRTERSPSIDQVYRAVQLRGRVEPIDQQIANTRVPRTHLEVH